MFTFRIFLIFGFFLSGCVFWPDENITRSPEPCGANCTTPQPPTQPETPPQPNSPTQPETSTQPNSPTQPDPVDEINQDNYFQLTNNLNNNIEVWYDNKTSEITPSNCAYVHNSLHNKMVVVLKKNGMDLKLCRPPDSSGNFNPRSSVPQRGTNYYYCKNEGRGFRSRSITNYIATNEDHLSSTEEWFLHSCENTIDP